MSTNTFVHNVVDGDTELPYGAVVRFRLALPYDNFATIECSVDDDGISLKVRSVEGSLVIEPDVSNQIHITSIR
jgi:hypothetical protein